MMVSSFAKLNNELSKMDDKQLLRLVYVSTLSKKLDASIFEHIRYHAEDYNRKNNIRGMLCNNKKKFMQCLEGNKDVLLPLMERIYNDDRHHSIKVILLKPIKEYSFEDWRMRSLNLDDSIWLKDSIQSNSPELIQFIPFRPLEWSEWFLEHFLETMRKFDDATQNYDIDNHSYNIVQDSNIIMTSIFDSTILHRVLLVMTALIFVIILKMNAIL